ncbi:phenylalanyl-tRNA synthetase mitochondrial precursor [Venturia nashicola]|nr:phenylalanyl-tRNA synthetase mitochondrial precursor [Venturia nashicola]
MFLIFLVLSNAHFLFRREAVERLYLWCEGEPANFVDLETVHEKKNINVDGRDYETDEWMNAPPTILSAISRRLHLQENHPLSITRQLIETKFPDFKYHNNLIPVVTTTQNFDSLGIPLKHVTRSRTDTYYINEKTVLRTQTSAHQADTFRAEETEGFLITGDVYRRDAIDRTHYPVFHQMEGALTWDRNQLPKGTTLAEKVWQDFEHLPKHAIEVEDPNPTFHNEGDGNPLQDSHNAEEVEAIAAHLKRSVENVVIDIFTRAQDSTATAAAQKEPLKIRWIEAYFPFTSPSWELEVWYQGKWLELLGCGIVKQEILNTAGVPSRIGWAFGLGLERIAMLLFNIPDIRLFWSKDVRFLSQFSQNGEIRKFVPFSNKPECWKDVSFWLPSSVTPAADGSLWRESHENDIMEIVREVAGDLVEDVELRGDPFVHPKSGKTSLLYRINYRSLERTLTNEEVNKMHNEIGEKMVGALGVELR